MKNKPGKLWPLAIIEHKFTSILSIYNLYHYILIHLETAYLAFYWKHFAKCIIEVYLYFEKVRKKNWTYKLQPNKHLVIKTESLTYLSTIYLNYGNPYKIILPTFVLLSWFQNIFQRRSTWTKIDYKFPSHIYN